MEWWGESEGEQGKGAAQGTSCCWLAGTTPLPDSVDMGSVDTSGDLGDPNPVQRDRRGSGDGQRLAACIRYSFAVTEMADK